MWKTVGILSVRGRSLKPGTKDMFAKQTAGLLPFSVLEMGILWNVVHAVPFQENRSLH